jgi:translation initiation factor 3 subunit B
VFEEEDAAEESNVSAELIALRKRLVDEWNAWRERCVEEAESGRGAKGRGSRKVRREEEKEEEREEIEVWIDEVIEQVEEVVE